MAKKKKDAKENIDNKEEFNDIDENFGLPELDIEPLDDSTEESVEEEAEKIVEEVVEETTNEVEEEIVEEDAYVAPQAAEEEVYSEEASADDGYTEEPADEKPAYVPGSYAAKARDDQSNSGKIIGIIVIVLLIGAGLWYFMYFRPAQQEAAEKAKQEQIAIDKAKKEKARIATEKAAEEQRLREEEARLQAEEDAKPKIGTIETISEKTSRYYVVVSSGLDGDLAMDYAKKEVNNGTNIKLLSPLGTNKFYRVTVADHDSWAAAENDANDLKSTFGDGVWVLKY